MKMNLIDTHCHLNFAAFDDDYLEVALRAKKSGLEKMIIVGADPHTSTRAVEICHEINSKIDQFSFAAVGIHPTHTDRADFAQIESLANDPLVVAIGETGFDFHRDEQKTTIIAQSELFQLHIDLAKKLTKPLIIHNRGADEEIFDLLHRNDFPRGVFHCFSTDHNFAKKVIERGYMISFTGNITYGNKKLKKVIERTPLEKMMVETDCPYITPEPLRSENNSPNEPANVSYIARKIALIKGLGEDEVAKKTAENARGFFNI